MWEKTLGLPKPLCITLFQKFFCFQIFNLHNKELTVKPVKRIRNRIRWLEESANGFFERDERTEREVTQRPSYAAETTQDVAV